MDDIKNLNEHELIQEINKLAKKEELSQLMDSSFLFLN